VGTDLLISAIKAVIMILLALNLALFLLYFERKGSALIQDRIGANRASVFGIGKRFGLPNLGIINTVLADPVKLFTKEDFVPDGADKFLHAFAPFIALFPVLVTFVAIPFGDTLRIGSRVITLQAAPLNVGVLYILSTIGIGVYGIALAGWSSNNRWSLLGGIRASAQMISYELAMGLAIIAIVMTYGTLDLQAICRAQGGVWFGWLPRWGILVQPVAFVLLLTAGIAESKRVPFDIPEGESELVLGYFTEYSGGKQAVFMLTDLAECALVAMLVTTFFFGGWQVPYLNPDGFHFPGHLIVHLPNVIVALLGVVSFLIKVLFFCLFQAMIRWTLPRFRYDQLMHLGWKGLLPLGLVNLVATATVIVLAGV
jgi:NADH-quinone oxidoreductase subunit H